MISDTEVQAGQVYVDADVRAAGRRLAVVYVKRQEKTEGRLKARYTYATCLANGKRVVKIDTDRLRSSAYRLVAAAPA